MISDLRGRAPSGTRTPNPLKLVALIDVPIASVANFRAVTRAFAVHAQVMALAIIRVWSSPSARRRSTRTRSSASWSSLTTGRSPLIRVPTRATECASVASVLRPCPVAKTRARAESFGGTSTTSSPSASSRIATWRPIPLHPSIAHPVRPLRT